ncbi:hypothetical protein D3C72_1442580 [compost metagenome]
MEQPAVEEQHVAAVQRERPRRLQQRLAGGVRLDQEFCGIQLARLQRRAVRSRDDAQHAVALVLVPQRQPHRHQLRLGKRPVARIAVPAGLAAVVRMLGHHAVVVCQRDARGLAQQCLHDRHQPGVGGPAAEHLVAPVGLAQAPDGAAAGGIARGWRAGIAQVGLELHRRHYRVQVLARHRLQLRARRLAGKAAQDHEAMGTKGLRQAQQRAGIGRQDGGGGEIGGTVQRGGHCSRRHEGGRKNGQRKAMARAPVAQRPHDARTGAIWRRRHAGRTP